MMMNKVKSNGIGDQRLNVVEAIVAIGINAGGTGVFMAEICNVLPDSVSEFHLLTCSSRAEPDLPIDERVNTIKLISEDLNKGEGLRNLISAKLTSLDDSEGVAVIHLHGVWLHFCHQVSAWSFKRKKLFVLSPHGMLEPWALNHKKWKKRMAWWLYQRRDLAKAHAFHACSEQEAESIRRLGFKQPIAVIPNGVQLPEFVDGRWDMVDGEPDLPRQRTALFLSRINPKKGLPMLLDAWKKLAPEDWRLVIAGNDDSNHLPVVQAKIEALGLSGQVEVVGSLFGDAKEQAYLNADLFVLPSYSENFGIVVTEALSYQLPVLTTRGCPWGELETERCGWWVDPTPEGVEQGLKAALATSNAELEEMGVRGRQLVEDKYQWPAIGHDMNRFYQWLAGKGEKPKFVV